MTNPRYVVAAITALAAGALTLGLSGIASAGTLPTTGNSITMTISNDTEQTIHLKGADNPYGQWMQSHASRSRLTRPRSSRHTTRTRAA